MRGKSRQIKLTKWDVQCAIDRVIERYPVDVFPKNSQTLEGKSAQFGRVVAAQIRDELFRLVDRQLPPKKRECP